MSFFGQIKEKISKMPHGEVFTVSDFTHIANEKTVSKILERLCGVNHIEKISRGIFWVPAKEASPSPWNVARTLARANNWRIAPSGESALYLFGLQNVPPKEWKFVTDGTYRNYKFGDNTLTFCHTSGKMFAAMSDKTAMLVQVLKAYGREHLPHALKEKLNLYTSEERRQILSETKNATSWISQSLQNLLSEK
ncbi:MAG: hypothetical protein KBS59_07425 [Clostridiales bacterium]|nr:hypothetical protein [Clostridiales bacterium]